MKNQVCQSCGMPITSKEQLGTNKDKSINSDYCKYCYENGEFIDKVTMEEYIKMCSQYGAQAGMTNEEMCEHCKKLFPTLKRWKMNLREKIEMYKPYNEQEKCDKEMMIAYIDTFEDVLTRKNKMCHFTASNWIVNKQRTKVLMIYHNIYKSWAWTGGHADGDSDLMHVALKEAREETGLENLRVLGNNFFGIQILTVDSHIKRGEYVPSHVHLDCCFLLEADENETIRIKPDENSGIKWIPLEEAIEITNEEKMKKIYAKLNEKLK